MEPHCTPGDRSVPQARARETSRRSAPRRHCPGPRLWASAPRRRNVTIRPMTEPAKPSHFIRDAVLEDLQSGRFPRPVVTRFPPEPNGYLHIGHAKAICLDFGLAQELGGRCHLRFDDTNPTKESQEYVDAITRDVHWLGFDWGTHLYFASDYFDRLYEWAAAAHPRRERLRGRPLRRRDPRAPRHPHRARAGEPVARPVGGGEPGPLPAHARGRVRGREQGPAREDRHGASPTSTCATRSCTASASHAPPHRRRVVRVPDVRLGARPVRLDRGRHPLAVHARVRGPPARSTTGTSTRSASTTRGRSSSRA